MRRVLRQMPVIVLLLCAVLTCTAAAAEPDYAVTYTITVADDGSALWRVEYRALLPTIADVADFEAYAADLSIVYLPQFRDLMERSAAQAAVATGRSMAVADVTGDAVMQESPTGRYGVVVYTALWDGFARPGTTLIIGDAFAGGLYLEYGNTLIIRYPDGYTVVRAEPAPDDTRDGLAWYGQRSFGAGEPRVELEPAAFPLLPVAIALVLIIAITGAGFAFRRRRTETEEIPLQDTAGSVSAGDAGPVSIEDRIVQLLLSQGGELFQSDIVRMTGLPRSTVSTALNGLHARGVIMKIRKGRENVIRLAPGMPPDSDQ
ncbi:MAG: hypothetical protein APR53_02905 [Methanoculleus sp. SDB]|nr:MAG: hypothetical protein APR53_02905 [Methanoculleus sp. SDB]